MRFTEKQTKSLINRETDKYGEKLQKKMRKEKRKTKKEEKEEYVTVEHPNTAEKI